MFYDFILDKYTLSGSTTTVDESSDEPPPDDTDATAIARLPRCFPLVLNATMQAAESCCRLASQNRRFLFLSAIVVPLIARRSTAIIRQIFSNNIDQRRKSKYSYESAASVIKSRVEKDIVKIKEVEVRLREALRKNPDLPRILWSIDIYNDTYSYQRHVLILNFLAGEKFNTDKAFDLVIK